MEGIVVAIMINPVGMQSQHVSDDSCDKVTTSKSREQPIELWMIFAIPNLRLYIGTDRD